MAQASWERLAEITSGRTRFQQRRRSNLQGPGEISEDTRIPEEGTGVAHELLAECGASLMRTLGFERFFNEDELRQ
jgi:hypothetical protein